MLWYRRMQEIALHLLLGDPTRDSSSVRRAFDGFRRVRGLETNAIRWQWLGEQHAGHKDLRREADATADEVSRLQAEMRQHPDVVALQAELVTAVDRAAELERKLSLLGATDRLTYELLAPPEKHSSTVVASSASVMYVIARSGGSSAGRYGAFVADADGGRVGLLDLGDIDEIDALIDRYRTAVVAEGSSSRPDTDSWRDPGTALSRILFMPIAAALGTDTGGKEATRLVVVPEGRIGVVPLGALPRAGGGYVMDEWHVAYRFHLPVLEGVTYEEDTGLGSAPLVFGAPDYGGAAPGAEAFDAGARQAAATDDDGPDGFLANFRNGARFDPLIGALTECAEVAGFLGTRAHTGTEATERLIKDADSPEAIHIATHGFWIAPDTSTPLPDEPPATLEVVDGLRRVGLAAAGANARLDGNELPDGADGIIYGNEIAHLDLRRTDLVTLSACQTGLGDIHTGDAVLGLQRAFYTAGAATIVCSLWDVPDKPTHDLFTSFYSRLVDKETSVAAFYASVGEMRERYPDHPVAWAGFVIYGEDRQLGRYSAARSIRMESVTIDLRRPAVSDGETSRVEN